MQVSEGQSWGAGYRVRKTRKNFLGGGIPLRVERALELSFVQESEGKFHSRSVGSLQPSENNGWCVRVLLIPGAGSVISKPAFVFQNTAKHHTQ